MSNRILEYGVSELRTAFAASALLLLLSAPSLAQDDADRAVGAEQYRLFCAGCHDGALLEAPQRTALSEYSPRRIVEALEFGVMATAGMPLTRDEKKHVAYFLTGNRFDEESTELASFSCAATLDNGERLNQPAKWNGWGGSLENTRHRADETVLDRNNVGELALKWAFAFPGATRSRSQPLVTPQVTFVGSQEGIVYALDNANGCPWWTFEADAEVRGALFVDTDEQGLPETLLFGDFAGSAYAINAQTGELKWKTLAHEHPQATITGSVIAHDGILIVPVSSSEIILASREEYSCCSFRGALTAISISSGEILWQTFTTDEPRPTIISTAGTQQYGPSGAPIWSSPTIDTRRNLVYAGTGENYSSPANENSDAIMAMDLNTGEVAWVTQLTRNDAWNGACSRRTANCPEENGPDYDFGASPMLVSDEEGREMLVIGQKSGMVYALDPNDDGAVLWERRAGSGGTMGGIHYGMATDGKSVYVGISDLPTRNRFNVGPGKPGMHALDLSSGEVLWSNLLPNKCEPTPFLCWQGISAAVSSSPGLVFAGGLDGILRAFDSDNGEILWETNTRQSFGTVNGFEAKGGAIEADGPVLANGQLYVSSGYDKWNQTTGNVLLVYSLNGE